MVMPRSRSCGIQSICASPSCTSPILWMRPAKKRKRSLTVVFPASMWATIPMLRTRVSFEGLGAFAAAGGAGVGDGDDIGRDYRYEPPLEQRQLAAPPAGVLRRGGQAGGVVVLDRVHTGGDGGGDQ